MACCATNSTLYHVEVLHVNDQMASIWDTNQPTVWVNVIELILTAERHTGEAIGQIQTAH